MCNSPSVYHGNMSGLRKILKILTAQPANHVIYRKLCRSSLTSGKFFLPIYGFLVVHAVTFQQSTFLLYIPMMLFYGMRQDDSTVTCIHEVLWPYCQ